MWVRMGTFRVKPGMAETLVATYNERAVPKVRAVPGKLIEHFIASHSG